MLLQDKVAIVYGAGGPIGGAAARAFAREGARVFLTGRTPATLDKVADEIRAAGGTADTARVDALDEQAVDAFADSVAERAGGIDISFNAIAVQDVQKPLAEISPEEFVQPIAVAARTQFLTIRAAVRHMIPRGSGVILMFGGGGPQTLPGLGGFKVALDAMEGIRRQWACEFGAHGIRVVTMISGGVPESMPDSFGPKEEIAAGLRESTLLGRTATLADVGDVAAFVASDRARTMTSATVNISCGAIVDH
ncbi:SDR family NAD(P)-dependent oxidoreductase [Nonomuraea jiangxiensis]|uniref:NAD(P)-dependent dehydrogenase, short-chain alcohol dehydrogenase family n=1 Tax=Nonomuraea jiangxiensis TaxID=633440 RepID=A0A1G9RHA4_9ACTN|nr:SDR family oxidoreductase [Nonomuraea jiangxiensis]SDM22702.1 NAD(P)-dependent dehydrogenase, short-chain alcohol dehydrogenase family [Nonomuraea jiangxiensis]